jgi:hypothetical protein
MYKICSTLVFSFSYIEIKDVHELTPSAKQCFAAPVLPLPTTPAPAAALPATVTSPSPASTPASTPTAAAPTASSAYFVAPVGALVVSAALAVALF